MVILAADDEKMGLNALISAIKKADETAEVFGFRSSSAALESLNERFYDAAFLDIQMPGMNGIELAKRIKLRSPKTGIVFSTGFDDYMKDAFQLHAAGYILKPITGAKVSEELKNLREIKDFRQEESVSGTHRIRFQCFGNFEILADGKPVKFKYDKTKEALAYIVSRRGSMCSNSEIISNLWDDEGHESYLRGIRKDLVDTFSELGLPEILNLQRGKISIDADAVDCDYYDFIRGDVAAINSYAGEFMSQYSWGEITNAELSFQRY